MMRQSLCFAAMKCLHLELRVRFSEHMNEILEDHDVLFLCRDNDEEYKEMTRKLYNYVQNIVKGTSMTELGYETYAW